VAVPALATVAGTRLFLQPNLANRLSMKLPKDGKALVVKTG